MAKLHQPLACISPHMLFIVKTLNIYVGECNTNTDHHSIQQISLLAFLMPF